ncbi:hypothetical protein CVT26_016066 [Gymnopilus dilepis]|uniref:Uncharacterized protein n=1 Tax=Gymnopilus dilepis TaxID=231916 RepID=A0A409YDR5_9AGAR|nr:hypothetical protein CVT26_016066 [Gymnopilus dilepis]
MALPLSTINLDLHNSDLQLAPPGNEIVEPSVDEKKKLELSPIPQLRNPKLVRRFRLPKVGFAAWLQWVKKGETAKLPRKQKLVCRVFNSPSKQPKSPSKSLPMKLSTSMSPFKVKSQPSMSSSLSKLLHPQHGLAELKLQL